MKPSLPARVTLATALLLSLSAQLLAQNPGYQAGQKIRWRDGITGKWEEGTFLYETPGGKQPVIQRIPGDPNSQTAYGWDRIQPWVAASGANPAPGVAPNPTGPVPTMPPPLPIARQPAIPPLPIARQPAIPPFPISVTPGAPLTQNEILDFLRQRLPGNPFADSQKLQQTKNELGELIKKRGLAFRYETLSDFGNETSRFGMTSEVTGPLSKNFGPPGKQSYLYGSWSTTKTGLPVKWVDGDKLITWTEAGAMNTGVVTINPNGTYVWRTDSAQGTISGSWRQATAEEMGDSGGEGVVLTSAKSGANWVVYKYREVGNPAEEWIAIVQLPSRQIREGGYRIPAK